MTKTKKGFTIIEVVLVLAIAGLIFLMVFIALPALQRSQRNTRRRSDMARVLSQLNEYQSNNNGRMPNGTTELNSFIQKYMGANQTYNQTGTCDGDQFCDPDGEPYKLTQHSFASDDHGPGGASTNFYDGRSGRDFSSSEGMTHEVHYWPGASCGDTEDTVKKGNGVNDVAIAYYLEGGAIYCGDNH